MEAGCQQDAIAAPHLSFQHVIRGPVTVWRHIALSFNENNNLLASKADVLRMTYPKPDRGSRLMEFLHRHKPR